MSSEPHLYKRRGLMLALVSPSGAGKTTLSRRLVDEDPDIALSVSWTTRAPRPGESDGVHYHFVDKDQFRAHRAQDGLHGGDLVGGQRRARRRALEEPTHRSGWEGPVAGLRRQQREVEEQDTQASEDPSARDGDGAPRERGVPQTREVLRERTDHDGLAELPRPCLVEVDARGGGCRREARVVDMAAAEFRIGGETAG